MVDTLSFSRRLQAAGVPAAQAEVHAQAQAEFIADNLLSQTAARKDIRDMATKEDVQSVREEVKHLETRLRMELQLLGKTLTVRLGGVVVLGVGVLAALVQL